MNITATKVEIKRSEWDCYIDTPDKVIDEVNRNLADIFETTHHPVIAQKRVYKYLYDNHREWGFSDSECNQAATDAINLYYNSNIDRWASLSL
jgi:hypothetical protein